jgi:hypothetical protein
MARRRNTNSRRSSGPRRRLFWARSTDVAQYSEGSPARWSNLLGQFNADYGADLFGFTVTRIVGHYSWFAADSQDVSTAYRLPVGIRVDEQSESIAGNARLDKLPINDPNADWMYVRNNYGITDSVQTHSSTRENAENRVELDLRSQRRLDELGQSLYLYHGMVPFTDVTVTFHWDLNILCKRP